MSSNAWNCLHDTKRIIKKPTSKVFLNLKVGQIPVSFSFALKYPDTLYMKQIPPTFGQTFSAKVLSETLNLDVKDIDMISNSRSFNRSPFYNSPFKKFTRLKRG